MRIWKAEQPAEHQGNGRFDGAVDDFSALPVAAIAASATTGGAVGDGNVDRIDHGLQIGRRRAFKMLEADGYPFGIGELMIVAVRGCRGQNRRVEMLLQGRLGLGDPRIIDRKGGNQENREQNQGENNRRDAAMTQKKVFKARVQGRLLPNEAALLKPDHNLLLFLQHRHERRVKKLAKHRFAQIK